MKTQLNPSFSAVFATSIARFLSKLSGSMSAARPVDPFLRDVRRVSAGPLELILATGSDEFIHEAVVDVDFRTFGRVPEFSPQSATRIPARNNHHIIL